MGQVFVQDGRVIAKAGGIAGKTSNFVAEPNIVAPKATMGDTKIDKRRTLTPVGQTVPGTNENSTAEDIEKGIKESIGTITDLLKRNKPSEAPKIDDKGTIHIPESKPKYSTTQKVVGISILVAAVIGVVLIIKKV